MHLAGVQQTSKMRSLQKFLLIGCFLFSARSETARETVFYNARIFTAEPESLFAEAISIRGATILACGTTRHCRASAPHAEMIDLKGQTLLPGFIDSHVHALWGGRALSGADAGAVRSVSDLAEFARAAIKTGRGMRGGVLHITGASLDLLHPIEQFNAAIDSGSLAQTPVFIECGDYHSGWANAALRRMAGITAEFIAALPESIRTFYGHRDFAPTGFGVDAGLDKIREVIPKRSAAEELAAGRAAVQFLNGFGITAWLDPNADESVLNAYKDLSERGELTARVAALPAVDLSKAIKAELRGVEETQKRFAKVKGLTIPGVKVYADGVAEFPAQTAAMLKPYRNSGRSGGLLFDPARFAEFCVAADQKKIIVHIHASGDRAMREALNGIEAARRKNRSNIGHTITHLQFVDPADFPRFGALQVIASFQFLWASADDSSIDPLEPYLDPAIFPHQYPARSLLHGGAILAGASDWPVSTPNVFEAIYQGETRRGARGVLNETECLPRVTLFLAYTRHAAQALGLLERIGSLAPGKEANLVAVDRDVLTVAPESLKEAKIIWTMVGGQKVFSQPPE